MRPFRSCSRFSFVKEWRKSISGRWKHRRTKVTSCTIQFLVGCLVIYFAGISHLSCAVKRLSENFMLVQRWKIFCKFWGQIWSLKFFGKFWHRKKHFLQKVCVDWGIMVQVAIPVRAVGVSKNKKKVNTFSNCIFHVYGEQTPLNRLFSFFSHRVNSPT